jgi:hypothetical protein
MDQVIMSELDRIIAEIKPEITECPETQKRQFLSYQEMKEYFENEVRFWQQFQKDRRPVKAFSEIERLIKAAADNGNPDQMRASIQSAVDRANQKNHALIYSRTVFARLVQRLWEKNPEVAEGAIHYHIDHDSKHNPNSPNALNLPYMEGVLLAFHNEHQELLSDDLQHEKKAFADLKAEIATTRDFAKSDYQRFTNEVSFWKDATKGEIQTFLSEERQLFEDSHKSCVNKFEESHQNWSDHIGEMEKLYNEKLRLEGPAQYWKQFETDYQRRGRVWAGLAVLATLFLIGFVCFVLYRPPEIFKSLEVTLAGAKGAVMLAIALSAIIYIVHLFVRFATSAYHLARDAREREQLTHVFLALIREKAAEPKEREIVLQALFSRADTGLLKGDSSPTMPTAFGNIAEVIKR